VWSVALIGALGLSVGSAAVAGSHDRQGGTDDRPNFIVILTDDQRADTLWAMPKVLRHLAQPGITFTRGFVSNSLCCPSRATILTGRYSHGTGVYTNHPPHGGFEAFQDESTIATWLDDAGYSTALVGKYFNGYNEAEYVPPGWDEWRAFSSHPGSGGAFYNYELSVNGTPTTYGRTNKDYSTDVLATMAVEFIRDSEDPFFLYFAPFAPHGAPAARRHIGAYRGVTFRPSPSFNEADVSDKPQWVQDLPLVSKPRRWSKALETLLAVDDAAGRMVQVLHRSGELDNTFIVFMSDNGKGRGEHRWRNKSDPYRGSAQVPFIVRYDRVIQYPREDGHLVLNLDVAPTIASLAGVASPAAEGNSIHPLLQSPDAEWRDDFLLEHLEDQRGIPSYCGVRTENHLYVAYDTDEEELYDLSNDPYELENLAGDVDSLLLLNQFRVRVRELCSPPPPGYTFPP
jgi:arylsulfatase A-like enzyme